MNKLSESIRSYGEKCALGLSAFIISLTLTACNKTVQKGGGSESSGRFAAIEKSIIQPKCLSCHSGPDAANGVDLSSYNAMMQSNVIVPMKPDASRFYTSIVSHKMPKGRDSLSNEEMKLIYAWIMDGAKPLDNQTGVPTPQPNYHWISENILQTRCVICHNTTKPRGKVDFTSYDTLMASLGHDGKPVVAGDPDKSGLYTEVAAKKMPPTIPNLNNEELRALYDWIADGAQKNGTPIPTPAPGTHIDPGPPQATYTWLSTFIFNRRCGACHGVPTPHGNVDFTSLETLLNSPGHDRKALVPHEPENSGIYRETTEGSMPPAPKLLSDAEVDVIGQWIKNGAHND